MSLTGTDVRTGRADGQQISRHETLRSSPVQRQIDAMQATVARMLADTSAKGSRAPHDGGPCRALQLSNHARPGDPEGVLNGVVAKTRRDSIGSERKVSTSRPAEVGVQRDDTDRRLGVARVMVRGRVRFERTEDMGDDTMPSPGALAKIRRDRLR